MQPTFIEVYLLPDTDKWGWSVGFADPVFDRCGDVATLGDAFETVRKIIEGETTNA